MEGFERVPPWPEVPPAQRGRGPLRTRYEDVSQDGRLGARPLSHALGAAVWVDVLEAHPLAAALYRDGAIPILSRMVIETGGGPISVRSRCSAEGAFALTRSTDASGEQRFRIDMWADVQGVSGRTHGPQPENAGQVIPIGRVYAEHVLSRVFGPREQRKVLSVPPSDVPVREGPWASPEALLSLPSGATWASEGETEDAHVVMLGVGHTDSNRHVNSLVHPQVLEEAALACWHRLGERAPQFASFVELRYRKPFFAGERLAMHLRPYRLESALGVVARFGVEGAPDARPHVTARLELVP